MKPNANKIKILQNNKSTQASWFICIYDHILMPPLTINLNVEEYWLFSWLPQMMELLQETLTLAQQNKSVGQSNSSDSYWNSEVERSIWAFFVALKRNCLREIEICYQTIHLSVNSSYLVYQINHVMSSVLSNILNHILVLCCIS